MKKKLKSSIKIALAVILLAVLAFMMRDANDMFHLRGYDLQATTASKFAKVAIWIPSGAEFYAAVDVPRFLSDASMRERIAGLIADKNGIAADLIASLIEGKTPIGMIMVAGKIGEAQSSPMVAVVAQGDFDEKIIIPSIRAILAAGRAGLSAESMGKRTLYVESGERNPFGFIILDREHIAVGSRESLHALFADDPVAKSNTGNAPEAMIFGHLDVGPRLIALLPQGVSPISNVDFESSDGQNLVAHMLVDTAQAQNLTLFLEGMRSLLILQEEDNPALTAILKNLRISNDPGGVSIVCSIPTLFDLW